MAAGNSKMQLETGVGWARGFNNMFRGELHSWFGTRKWWTQIIIWAASINFIYLMVALSERDAPSSGQTMIFNVFLGLVGPIGASIIMQNTVVGEKKAGTAAWVLSKPVTRISFILSKLTANTLGLAVTMLLAQGLIAYLITAFVMGVTVPVPGFLAAMGVHLVHILFYVTLTLFLGTIFNRTAPVIGVPMAFFFFQSILPNFYPTALKVLPWVLALPWNNSPNPSMASALMEGVSVPTMLPFYCTVLAITVFIAASVWIFKRQEL
jgi:ABC-2 type transport system permease protein